MRETIGLILCGLGGLMIGPAWLLHRRAGHLVAPRPIVLVLVFAGMLVAGICVLIST